MTLAPAGAGYKKAGPQETGEILIICVMALPALVICTGLLFRSTLYVSINYNEGWNAYHALSLTSGGTLYHAPKDLITNNYPPLSFVLVGALSRLIGDAVFAGRLLAAVSFFGVIGTISAIIYRFDRDLLASLTGGLIFLIYMVINETASVAEDDPQMTAHAVSLLGLYVYVRWLKLTWASFATGALMCFSLFIKNNIIALPIALAGWLLLLDRAAFIRFALTGLVLAALGLGACVTFWGQDFVTGLLSPRRYSPARAWHFSVEWLSPLAALISVSALGAMLERANHFSQFCGYYLVAAVIVGIVTLLGSGTGANAFFDVVIACSLGCGHLVARLRLTDLPRSSASLWAVGASGFASALTPNLIVAKDVLLMPSWIADQRAEETATKRTVQLIADQAGPALCDLPVLCFWADKPFEFDSFNFTEGVHAGIKRADLVRQRIASQYYAVIELRFAQDDLIFSPEVLALLGQNYRLIPAPLDAVKLYIR